MRKKATIMAAMALVMAVALAGSSIAAEYWGTLPSLKLGYSVRSEGMGGAGLALDGDLSLAGLNPAALPTTKGLGLYTNYTSVYATNGKFSLVFGCKYFGIALDVLGATDIEITDEYGAIIGVGDYYEGNVALIGGYSFKLGSMGFVSVGASLKGLGQFMPESDGYGFALDVGAIGRYDIGKVGLSAAFVLRNAPGIIWYPTSSPLPEAGTKAAEMSFLDIAYAGGIAAHFFDEKLLVALDVDSARGLSAGIEGKVSVLSLRTGVNWWMDRPLSFSLGAGLDLFKGARLDYSWTYLVHMPDRHRVGLLIRF